MWLIDYSMYIYMFISVTRNANPGAITTMFKSELKAPCTCSSIVCVYNMPLESTHESHPLSLHIQVETKQLYDIKGYIATLGGMTSSFLCSACNLQPSSFKLLLVRAVPRFLGTPHVHVSTNFHILNSLSLQNIQRSC